MNAASLGVCYVLQESLLASDVDHMRARLFRVGHSALVQQGKKEEAVRHNGEALRILKARRNGGAER
jgi:hypothetical protein